MKFLLKIVFFFSLVFATANATVIGGTVTNNNVALANGSVKFQLLGCSVPLLNSSSGPSATKTYGFTLDANGSFPAASVSGNDTIYCSGVLGTTYYELQAYNSAGGLVWDRYYKITKILWNIGTATILTNFNVSSYVLTNPSGDQIISVPPNNNLSIVGGQVLIDNLQVKKYAALPSDVATKQYVDTTISQVNSAAIDVIGKVNKSGDTMTGPLVLTNTTPIGQQAASANYVQSQITPLTSSITTATNTANTANSTANTANSTANTALSTANSAATAAAGSLKGSPTGNQTVNQPTGTSFTTNSLNTSAVNTPYRVNAFTTSCHGSTQPGYDAQFGVNFCQYYSYLNATPGFNIGNDGISPNQGWSTHIGVGGDLTDLGSGIFGDGMTYIKAGVGDIHSVYNYVIGYGGEIAASDEAEETFAGNGGEATSTYTGTIISGGSQALTVKVNCTNDCNYPGVGRYLTTPKPTPYSSFIKTIVNLTDNIPSIITVNDTIPVSTAWGTLSSNVATANPIVPSDPSSYQVKTFNVNILNGTFVVNDLVCFSGNFHEQARISSVGAISGGVQSVTIPLRHSHVSGSWIMANGVCGSAIVAAANTVSGLQYPQDVIGSTDSHTIRAVSFQTAVGHGFYPGNMNLSSSSGRTISRTGGVVLIDSYNGQQIALLNQTVISISNATVSSLNGTCTNVVFNSDGTKLQCNQAGPDVVDTSNTGVFTVGDTGYGNTRFSLVDMAEVLDVRDLTQPAGSEINGTFHVEANNASWTPSNSILESHHYAAQFAGMHLGQNSTNPVSGLPNVGIDLTVSGIFGSGNSNPNSGSLLLLRNNDNTSKYFGLGGTQYAPNAITQRGTYYNNLFIEYMPTPGGIGINYAGGPQTPLGLADPGYSFFPLFMNGNGGYVAETYTPSTVKRDESIYSYATNEQMIITKTPRSFSVAIANGSGRADYGFTTSGLSAPAVTAMASSSQFASGTQIGSKNVCLTDGTNCPTAVVLTTTCANVTSSRAYSVVYQNTTSNDMSVFVSSDTLASSGGTQELLIGSSATPNISLGKQSEVWDGAPVWGQLHGVIPAGYYYEVLPTLSSTLDTWSECTRN